MAHSSLKLLFKFLKVHLPVTLNVFSFSGNSVLDTHVCVHKETYVFKSVVYNYQYFYQHYHKLNILSSCLLERQRSVFLLYERM